MARLALRLSVRLAAGATCAAAAWHEGTGVSCRWRLGYRASIVCGCPAAPAWLVAMLAAGGTRPRRVALAAALSSAVLTAVAATATQRLLAARLGPRVRAIWSCRSGRRDSAGANVAVLGPVPAQATSQLINGRTAGP